MKLGLRCFFWQANKAFLQRWGQQLEAVGR
jgi:hypothetical protein